MAKINWIKAREDYLLDSNITLENIADKYLVSPEIVRRNAAKEGWVTLRRKLNGKFTKSLQKTATDVQEKYLQKKLKEGQEMADLGRKVLLVRKTSIGTLVAKELWVEGHRLQTEALGLDNPKNQINIQNNLAISFSEIVKKVRERAEREANG